MAPLIQLKNTTALIIKTVNYVHNVQPEYKIYAIAGIHTIGITYGLYLTIDELLVEAAPVENSEICYILGHLMIHLGLIISLIKGTLEKRAKFLIPWLVAAFLVFATATCYALYFAFSVFLCTFLYNICSLGILWFMWITVYSFYKTTTNLIKL